MKKILVAGVFALGAMGLYSCDNQGGSGTATDADERLISRDTVATEYEVEETIVETDTTTRTETIERDNRDNRRNN